MYKNVAEKHAVVKYKMQIERAYTERHNQVALSGILQWNV